MANLCERKPFTCVICGESFKKLKTMLHHKYDHSQSPWKGGNCLKITVQASTKPITSIPQDVYFLNGAIKNILTRCQKPHTSQNIMAAFNLKMSIENLKCLIFSKAGFVTELENRNRITVSMDLDLFLSFFKKSNHYAATFTRRSKRQT